MISWKFTSYPSLISIPALHRDIRPGYFHKVKKGLHSSASVLPEPRIFHGGWEESFIRAVGPLSARSAFHDVTVREECSVRSAGAPGTGKAFGISTRLRGRLRTMHGIRGTGQGPSSPATSQEAPLGGFRQVPSFQKHRGPVKGTEDLVGDGPEQDGGTGAGPIREVSVSFPAEARRLQKSSFTSTGTDKTFLSLCKG